MIKRFADYWYFSRKYAQFLRVSSLSAPLAAQQKDISERGRKSLKELNRQKLSCHVKVARLNLSSFAECESCAEGCCNNPSRYYFTPIDFWLYHHGSSAGLQYFSQQQAKPFHQYLHGRMKILSRHLLPVGGRKPALQAREQTERCPFLGDDGCRLPYEYRPIKCVIYACPRLKKSMNEATRLAYREAVRDLVKVSLKTFNVMKTEAGFPPAYGVPSVFFVP